MSRLRSRTLIVLLPLMAPALGACGGGVDADAVQRAIERSPQFRKPRVVVVPTRQTVDALGASRDGQAWDEQRIAERVDKQLAILHWAGLLRMSDQLVETPAPVGSAQLTHVLVDRDAPYGEGTPYRSESLPSTYTHVISFRRSAKVAADDPDWLEDDGDAIEPRERRLQRGEVAGWKVVIARPEVIDVDRRPQEPRIDEDVPPGAIAVAFTWRMQPTASGAAWDRTSDVNRRLPDALREAAQWYHLERNDPRAGVAYVRRVDSRYEVVHLRWR